MGRTTHSGYIRQYGSNKGAATPCPFIAALVAAFDSTASTAVLLGTLPKGAIPLGVDGLGGGTGGTSPTVDVGTVADPDGLAAELDADGVAFNGSGALTGVELTVDTDVYGMVGASAATGGETKVVIKYVMADDGAHSA